MTEEDNGPEAPEVDSISPLRVRRPRVLLIAGLLALVVGGLVWFLAASRSGNDGFAPVSTHSLSFSPPPAKKGTLYSQSAGVAVVIRASDQTCWRGYVLGKPVNGCGSDRFNFSGTSSVYGANARKTSADHQPIELELIVDGKVLDTDSSSEPFGLVSVNGEPAAPSSSP